MEGNMSFNHAATNYNQKQAARYLGMSTSFLKQKRLDGAGPAYCRVGKRVIYRQEDLDNFLQKHRVETTG
jgi:hypothetical protein